MPVSIMSSELRTGMMSKESMIPLKVSEIHYSPLAQYLPLARKDDGEVDLGFLLNRTNRELTVENILSGKQTDSMFYATDTTGRAVIFPGLIFETPKLKSGGDKITVVDESGQLVWYAIDIKGGGPTNRAMSRMGSTNPRGQPVFHRDFNRTQSGVFGDKNKAVFGADGDLIGANDFGQRMKEMNLSLLIAATGARIPVPILVAKISSEDEYFGDRINPPPTVDALGREKLRQPNEYGLIVRASRSPLTFSDIMLIPMDKPDLIVEVLADAFEKLNHEGLMTVEEMSRIGKLLKNRNLESMRELSFWYCKKGAEILGKNLALVHKVMPIGNRNPQNISSVFEIRDLADGPDMRTKSNTKKSNEYKVNDLVNQMGCLLVLARYFDFDFSEKKMMDLINIYINSYLDTAGDDESKTIKSRFKRLKFTEKLKEIVGDEGSSLIKLFLRTEALEKV